MTNLDTVSFSRLPIRPPKMPRTPFSIDAARLVYLEVSYPMDSRLSVTKQSVLLETLFVYRTTSHSLTFPGAAAQLNVYVSMFSGLPTSCFMSSNCSWTSSWTSIRFFSKCQISVRHHNAAQLLPIPPLRPFRLPYLLQRS